MVIYIYTVFVDAVRGKRMMGKCNKGTAGRNEIKVLEELRKASKGMMSARW
jgi:hypothetical protein